MLKKDKILDYLKKATKFGVDFADVFAEESSSLIITCEDDKIEKIISGKDNGVGIRKILKDKTDYSYTNDFVKGDSPKGTVPFYIEEKVKFVNIANRIARSYDSRIKQVTVSYMEKFQHILIANSYKNIVEEKRNYLIFFVNVIASDAGIIQTGFETYGKSTVLEPNEFNPEEIAERAAKRAILMLSAKQSPALVIPVVLDKSAGGTMIHEAIGHSLEADLIQKGMSKFKDKIGEKIASSIVTVVDDPTIPGQFGYYNFDDEGTKSKRTVLVDKGVLTNYLYDNLSALKDGKKSTGNGRRESYQHKPIPRMSNTFILPGTKATKDIISRVKKGLYVKRMGGGQVNPVTSDFVFDVKEGYMIENGEITHAVRGAILTGNGLEVLQNIEIIGDEFEFMPGRCGKDGQLVPVGDAEPTILISEIIIGGTKI